MTTTKPFTLGSISTGTLRTEDLLPAFAEAYRPFNAHGPLIKICDAVIRGGKDVEEEDLGDIIDRLQHNLNEICPPFVYFGTHPGDGADFGFWPDWDTINDTFHPTDKPGLYANDSTYDSPFVMEIHANGVDVTVTDLAHNVLWSTL